MDSQWKVPLLNVVLFLENGLSNSSPLGVALTDVLAQVLKENLNAFAYYADCAGLHYDVQLAKGGLDLQFYGYHVSRLIFLFQLFDDQSVGQAFRPCGKGA